MAEEKDDSGKTMAFLLGFLLGVLVCLGGGGVAGFVYFSRMQAQLRQAEMRAMEQTEIARVEQMRADQQRQIAEAALKKANAEGKVPGAKD